MTRSGVAKSCGVSMVVVEYHVEWEIIRLAVKMSKARTVAVEKTDLLPEEGSAQSCAVLRAVSEGQEGTPLFLWQQEGLMPDSQRVAVPS